MPGSRTAGGCSIPLTTTATATVAVVSRLVRREVWTTGRHENGKQVRSHLQCGRWIISRACLAMLGGEVKGGGVGAAVYNV
jgi:hypothetical protein